MKSRWEDSQKVLWCIQEACAFLCLLSIAEEELVRQKRSVCTVDLLDAAVISRRKGWLAEDFTVLNDCAILEYLTDKRVTKEVLYARNGVVNVGNVADNQYTMEKHTREDGKALHFKRRYFDVYNNPNRKGYKLTAIYKYTIGE